MTGAVTKKKAAAEALDVDAILSFDRARRAHLEGRYTDAIALYRDSLSQGLNKEMTAAAHFFTALALLHMSDARATVDAFDVALADPVDEWRASAQFYRARALEALGDLSAAIAGYLASDLPSAAQEVERLRSGR